MPASRCPPIPGRDADFADLTVWRARVFALARNAHVVMHLEPGPAGWTEGGAWSYALTENAPRFAYRDRAFGVAEGLAIDDEHVFIVCYNNRDERDTQPGDRRPLLFVFRNPGPAAVR